MIYLKKKKLKKLKIFKLEYKNITCSCNHFKSNFCNKPDYCYCVEKYYVYTQTNNTNEMKKYKIIYYNL